MSENDICPPETTAQPQGAERRKPRLALMGEFSAGKSTLCNLLIGTRYLPTRVTATQLPPVWISYGTDAPYRLDRQGNRIPISIAQIDEVPLAETALIRLFLEADILELCDLIDMPGISDPSMSSDVWESVIPEADGVLWCTHATQAWRQSEAAVWRTLPDSLHEKSLLLITRIDKILSEDDRRKVARRVVRETAGQFAGVFPISLTEAIDAEWDREMWEASGAEQFTQRLLDLLTDFGALERAMNAPRLQRQARAAVQDGAGALAGTAAPAHQPAPADAPAPVQTTIGAVRPRRVRSRVSRTPRPARGSLPAGLPAGLVPQL